MEARIDTHPSPESLNAFSLGRMDDASAQALFLHLEQCPACRDQVEAVSDDNFLARLQKARAFSATPAPSRSLPGGAKADSWSTNLPDPRKSLASLAPGMSIPLESTVSDLPPELVANEQYEIIRELGRGGMGVVYLARNRPMDRLEVLKVVNRNLLDRPGTVERFLREIRSAAALEHKNVVRAYSCLQQGKLLALVMQYVVGEDLAHLVERRGPLSVSSACSSVIQAARGLQKAHTKNMVHRDIKPQNLILSLEIKEVMILDFGLAKVASEKGIDMALTGTGQTLGTPAYMAPEQILDAAKADIRADIYSLGCTLYFLLSGRPPFHAKSLYELFQAHHSTAAKPLNEERPNVPAELAAVVARMMAKDPAQRYQTPAEVEAALRPFVKAAAAAPLAIPLMPERKKTKVAAPAAGDKSRLGPVPAQGHGVSVWAHLDEPEPATAKPKSSPAPKSSPEARTTKRRPVVTLIAALALLVPLTAWLAAVILRVETPNGTLLVEVNDDETEARIKGGKLILSGPDGKTRYTLTAKERNKKLDAGPYKIRVEGADGLALDTPEFTLKKGGEVRVRVRVEGKETPINTPKAKEAGWVSLFNGKDLTGWKVDGGEPNQWHVKDGVIVASSPGYQTRNYLLSDATYSNFVLRFDFRIGTNRSHGGVTLRAEPGEEVPIESTAFFDHPMIKLTHAGHDPKDSTGTSHWLRNAAPFTPPVSRPEVVVGKWHNVEVTVRGDTCTASFDGKPAVDIRLDSKAPTPRNFVPGLKRLNGRIGFQINTGNLQFRNVELKKSPRPY